MAVNKYKPHLLVLPEDKANNDIYNGFVLHPDLRPSAIQALPIADGWLKVLESFVDDLLPELGTYPQRFILLLIDFDTTHFDERFELAVSKIPEQYRDRVFVLGALSEPEKLKSAMKHASSEAIGKKLAEDCVNDTSTTWNHELLRHNQPEVERLRKAVKPFLFA